MDSSAAEPEFHDVRPEDQLPMTLTTESLDHVVIAWGAEYSYDGNSSALSFKFLWSCFFETRYLYHGLLLFSFSEAQGVTSIQFLDVIRIIGPS